MDSTLILQSVVTVLCSVIASSGMWAWLSTRSQKKDAKTKMLLGLGHDRIVSLCIEYIDRGFITYEEFDNLYNYLYKPYKELGGNGTCSRLMEAVQKLPIKHMDPNEAVSDDTENEIKNAQF